MITLYTFGRGPGLPDFSPFVIKTMLLLKLAGLDYIERRALPSKGPKGKLPYIDDDGVIVADSTLIRWHIEKTRGIDLDKGLTPEQRAIAWAAEKMCEDHLYWIAVRGRWLNDANFARGPARFFDSAPALLRPFIKNLVRGRVRKALHGQGIGRYTEEEVTKLGLRDLETLATLLGDKPYFFGDNPCGADAVFFAFIAGILTPVWESPLRDAAERAPHIVAYRDRILASYFPEIPQAKS